MAKAKKSIVSNSQAKKHRTSIGALWLHESAKGEGYYRGIVELNGDKISVVAFDNSLSKKNENSPNIQLFRHEPLATVA